MYQRILIATDGSALSKQAVESGLSLAALTGAHVIALKVAPRYPMTNFEGGMTVSAEDVARVEQQWTDDAKVIVDEVQAAGSAKGVTVEAVTASSDLIAEAIIETAKAHDCDLIVMASHGRRGLKRLLLGSETTHVLTHSHIPVLVLR